MFFLDPLFQIEGFDVNSPGQVVQYYHPLFEWCSFDALTSRALCTAAKRTVKLVGDVDFLSYHNAWLFEGLARNKLYAPTPSICVDDIPRRLIQQKNDTNSNDNITHSQPPIVPTLPHEQQKVILRFNLNGITKHPLQIRFVSNSEKYIRWFYWEAHNWYAFNSEIDIFLEDRFVEFSIGEKISTHIKSRDHIYLNASFRFDLREYTVCGMKRPFCRFSDLLLPPAQQVSPFKNNLKYGIGMQRVCSSNGLPFPSLDVDQYKALIFTPPQFHRRNQPNAPPRYDFAQIHHQNTVKTPDESLLKNDDDDNNDSSLTEHKFIVDDITYTLADFVLNLAGESTTIAQQWEQFKRFAFFQYSHAQQQQSYTTNRVTTQHPHEKLSDGDHSDMKCQDNDDTYDLPPSDHINFSLDNRPSPKQAVDYVNTDTSSQDDSCTLHDDQTPLNSDKFHLTIAPPCYFTINPSALDDPAFYFNNSENSSIKDIQQNEHNHDNQNIDIDTDDLIIPHISPKEQIHEGETLHGYNHIAYSEIPLLNPQKTTFYTPQNSYTTSIGIIGPDNGHNDTHNIENLDIFNNSTELFLQGYNHLQSDHSDHSDQHMDNEHIINPMYGSVYDYKHSSEQDNPDSPHIYINDGMSAIQFEYSTISEESDHDEPASIMTAALTSDNYHECNDVSQLHAFISQLLKNQSNNASHCDNNI